MKLAFGDCVLDLASRQLFREGNVVPLEPKMFELLEVLIKRRPAVVANNELVELLWPRVYVARTSLTRLVSELRSVLGDTPRDSRFIRTAYKTGYAFTGTVTTLSPSSPLESGLPFIGLIWRDRLLPLTEGEQVAGRDEECELVIDAETVSRRHARITVVGGDVTIEDLNSTNGTHVNGTTISTPTRIVDGNRVSLGTATLIVRRRDPSKETVKVTDEDRDVLMAKLGRPST
jgi:DNA-binding winged helix-turn-helix (wHTH) protein